MIALDEEFLKYLGISYYESPIIYFCMLVDVNETVSQDLGGECDSVVEHLLSLREAFSSMYSIVLSSRSL
jgi:hypothetical protein